MGLSFHYILRSQTTLPAVKHLNAIQTAIICSLQVENTKILLKKLIEPEKITKILEDH